MVHAFESGGNPLALTAGPDGALFGVTTAGGNGGMGTVFRLNADASRVTLVHFHGANGRYPNGPMVLGSDGNFYGTTSGGDGYTTNGTVFRMTPAGVLTTVANFNNGSTSSSTVYPTSLVAAPNGVLYGTTSSSYNTPNGVIFRLTTQGQFSTVANVGTAISGPLLLAADGNLYGTTASAYSGSTTIAGTAFRVNPATGAVTTLATFDSNTTGSNPVGGVVVGSDGNFYGVTSSGGTSDYSGQGTIFRLTPAGALSAVKVFTYATGGNTPRTRLLATADGYLYGTTSSGGTSSYGTVFRYRIQGGALQTVGNLTTYSYSNTVPGAMVAGTDGNVYGTLLGNTNYNAGGGSVYQVTPAGVFNPVVVFGDPFSSTTSFSYYSLPTPGLSVVGGALYGALPTGPNGGNGSTADQGVVYRATTAGGFATVAAFTGKPDGTAPASALVSGPGGTVFGTTAGGGTAGYGSVFRVNADNTRTTVASFDGATTGSSPLGLTVGPDGNFYGFTSGGSSSATSNGTVFRVTPAGALSLVAKLTAVGSNPVGVPAFAPDGTVYGVLTNGTGYSYSGSVFKLLPDGTAAPVVNFTTATGTGPNAGLTLGADGNFYGTTINGGNFNNGAVYRLTPAGSISVAADFYGGNGRIPVGPLALAPDGNLYGATNAGGASGYGTVFRLDPSGGLTTLLDFDGGAAGGNPQSGPVRGPDGNLYGLAHGALYRLTLPSFAKGDFNADGQGDLVWQNLTTGERVIWFLQNGVYQGGSFLPNVPVEWSIAGVADFNADGQGDLVWQNRTTGQRDIWLMRNGVPQSAFSFANINPEWSIAGAADFNADGQADLVWQNARTGERVIWFMRNGRYQSGVALSTVDVAWQIAGAGDLNGDGQADLVWQNVNTGERVAWFLKNGVYQSGVYLPTVDKVWSIAGVVDFNGDGYADLVWQNTQTGERVIWFLKNAQFQSGTYLPTVDPAWQIADH